MTQPAFIKILDDVDGYNALAIESLKTMPLLFQLLYTGCNRSISSMKQFMELEVTPKKGPILIDKSRLF